MKMALRMKYNLSDHSSLTLCQMPLYTARRPVAYHAISEASRLQLDLSLMKPFTR